MKLAYEPQDLWNLPQRSGLSDRGETYVRIITSYAAGRPLDILEIGVFKAGIIDKICRSDPKIIKSYVGVDPYIGDESDPYFTSYWKSQKSTADLQYEESKKVFERYGAVLLREKSDDFFLKNQDTFDLIIVDGDHRAEPAFRDLGNSVKILRPGGLLICDDYGNSDTPDVTRAVVRFVETYPDFFDASGYKPIWFLNARKPAPIQLSAIYWRKKTAEG